MQQRFGAQAAFIPAGGFCEALSGFRFQTTS
jgi:hypothetical protein